MKSLILFLILSQTSHATFSFDGKPANLTARDFSRYVLPQLKSIEKEFFTLIQDFHPNYRYMLKIKKIIDIAKDDIQEVQKVCKETSPNSRCNTVLGNLKSSWRKIGVNLDELSLLAIDTKIGDNRYKKLQLNSKLENLISKQLEIHGYIHTFALFQDTSISQKRNLKDISESINLFGKLFDIYFLSPLDSNVKDIYSNAYRHFISPLKNYVISPREKKYLLDNVEMLNFTWNAFHMRISKTNLQVSRETKKLATQVHRRWVSVLKLMLR